MFDVFDLILPNLKPVAGFELRQYQTAFGPDDRQYLYVGELQFAQVLPVNEAYRTDEAWAGGVNRQSWMVLVMGKSANHAMVAPDSWARYLAALRLMLKAHTHWRITCESDCEQYPLARLDLDADALADLLEQYRVSQHYPIAFFSEHFGA